MEAILVDKGSHPIKGNLMKLIESMTFYITGLDNLYMSFLIHTALKFEENLSKAIKEKKLSS